MNKKLPDLDLVYFRNFPLQWPNPPLVGTQTDAAVYGGCITCILTTACPFMYFRSGKGIISGLRHNQAKVSIEVAK